MKITAIKTPKILPSSHNLHQLLADHITALPERSVVAITSKVVALCEGRAVPIKGTNKDELITQESELYLPRTASKYNLMLTINSGLLAPSAGIDESNGDGYYILWPAAPQQSANHAREFLCQHFGVKNVGVIITDSVSAPLRWGVTGMAMAASGFESLHEYIGTPDIFGRPLAMTRGNHAAGLAAAAVVVMGEGNEQTPLAVIEDVPFVNFTGRNPTAAELAALKIDIVDDVYAPLLQNAPWQKGKKGSAAR